MILGIPFGQDKDTGEWCDVAEVSRGLACNCICPSCKLPLSARHGDERDWHFAHHTRNIPKEKIVDCEFSFEVSLRMMTHQLLLEGVFLKLPEYVKSVIVPKSLKGNIKPEVKIAKEQCLRAADSKLTVDADFFGHKVDALYQFDTASLVVYLVYRGRKFPFELSLLRDVRAGVLLLDIEDLAQIFYHHPMAETEKLGTAKSQLMGWLQTSIEAKHWLYHPRENELLDKKHQLINDALQGLATGSNVLQVPLHQQIKCQCIGCGKNFTGIRNKINPCPNCQTHLYVTNC
ncbi:Conserved hypothetical protein [Shewanella piezotolerans WP3]|uniref:Competence protein n=1 Tax=Shewanella piezotolerans (strain WP3 / JCM 13877) TaxID=225849 RepID=B8CM17_SHEPW|nr:hypothetical protein [Shewanella piezotolerans]ACJ28941.1 Conserved hypothetical protein [Shewanella piezotolerans WP3]